MDVEVLIPFSRALGGSLLSAYNLITIWTPLRSKALLWPNECLCHGLMSFHAWVWESTWSALSFAARVKVVPFRCRIPLVCKEFQGRFLLCIWQCDTFWYRPVTQLDDFPVDRCRSEMPRSDVNVVCAIARRIQAT